MIEADLGGQAPRRDFVIEDGDTLTLGDMTLHFEHTPGHTPGTISMRFPVFDNGQRHETHFHGGSALRSDDPEIAADIRQRLFAFDDIARLSEADVRALIETVEMDELLVALKAAGKGVLDAVLSAVSERRRGRLKEDMAVLPKMRLSEVEAAQQRIVQNLRRLEAQGIVDLSRPADGDTWV